MSAKVTFLELERPAAENSAASAERQVTVSKDAIVSRDGQPTVFEVRDGKALGAKSEDRAERQGRTVIREGLRGGEILVSRPPETLKDGDGVRLKS